MILKNWKAARARSRVPSTPSGGVHRRQVDGLRACNITCHQRFQPSLVRCLSQVPLAFGSSKRVSCVFAPFLPFMASLAVLTTAPVNLSSVSLRTSFLWHRAAMLAGSSVQRSAGTCPSESTYPSTGVLESQQRLKNTYVFLTS